MNAQNTTITLTAGHTVRWNTNKRYGKVEVINGETVICARSNSLAAMQKSWSQSEAMAARMAAAGRASDMRSQWLVDSETGEVLAARVTD